MSDRDSLPNTSEKEGSISAKDDSELPRLVVRLKENTEEHEIYYAYLDELVRQRKKIPSDADIGRFFIRQYPEVKKLRQENEELKKRINELEKVIGDEKSPS
ncbi:MAG: hypothetical protein ACE5OZ_07270 [Candidatus Heimdallarchaeota archaeon]